MSIEENDGDLSIIRAAETLGYDERAQREFQRYEETMKLRAEQRQIAPEREMLEKARTAEQVTYAMRLFSDQTEAANNDHPEFYDRYGQLNFFLTAEGKLRSWEAGTRKKRAELAALGFTDLTAHEIVPDLQIDQVQILDSMSDKQKQEIEARNRQALTHNQKNQEERAIIEENRDGVIDTLRRECRLFAARAKLTRETANYHNAGGSITEIAKGFLAPAPYQINAEDFEAIFTAGPGLVLSPDKRNEFRNNPNARHLGNDVSMAIMLYDLVAASENKTKMLDYIQSPGFKRIVAGEKEGEVLRGFTKRFIGNPSNWKEENKKVENANNPSQSLYTGERTKEDLKIEANDRGLLTVAGNVFAHKESTRTRQVVDDIVCQLVGGNQTAQLIAKNLYRVSGAAAAAGAEIYKDGNRYLPEVEGYPAGSDDLVALTQFKAKQIKDREKGSPCGVIYTCGLYPDLLADFWSFQTVEGAKGSIKVKRSLREYMWGGGDGVHDLDAGHLLGEVDWKSFPPELWQEHKLRMYYGGRDRTGLAELLKRVRFTPDELTNYEFWQTLNKAVGIVVHDSLVTGGNYRDWDGRMDQLRTATANMALRIKGLFVYGVNTRQNQWLRRDHMDQIDSRTRGIDLMNEAVNDAKFQFTQFNPK
ncbi:hypothetical protein IPM62_00400 [Candidatus Woesebacteria bacterium]|nr:MAG: hypothetical protein IPM62_00400 [Candidatus Woesebacteria bacterium]